MKASLHSIERAKDRAGLNPKAAQHFMRNALERGKDKTMFTHEKRKRLSSKEYCQRKALVYNDMCLIVDRKDVVITLFNVPTWFKKSNRYNGKERIRNRAKFERFNRQPPEPGCIL